MKRAFAVVCLITLAISIAPMCGDRADAVSVVAWSGVVKASDGTPVPYAQLTANSSTPGQWSSTVTASATGTFTLNVVPGEFTLTLGYEWNGIWTHPTTLPKTFTLTVAYTLTNPATDLTLPATNTLTLHVEDTNGNPLAGATVSTGPFQSDSITVLGTTGTITYRLNDVTGTSGLRTTTDINGTITRPIWPTTSLTSINASYTNGTLTTSRTTTATITANTTTIAIENIASVDSEGSVDGEVTVVSPDDTSLSDVTNSPTDPADIPADIDPLTGSLDYTLTGIDPGSTQDITLVLPDGADPTGVGMIVDGEFVDLTDPSVDLATIDGDTITIEITDGGVLDADGLANGVIVDPVIPFGSAAATFMALPSPKRLVDTRAGQIGEIEKPGGSVGNDVSTQLVANVPTRWVVTNQAGIPSTVAGLAINLTAISPPSGGNLRLYPCTTAGATPPSTSNINYIAGKTLANSAIVTPATNGGICALSTATLHIIIDTSGYLPSVNSFAALTTPKRLVDTRAGQIGEIEKPGGSVGSDIAVKLVANVPTRWVVTNQAGIPSTVAGLAVNLTAISPPSGGNLRLYPCTTAGATPPSTSNINYIAGVTLANSAIVTPAANGGICALSTNSLHVIVDASGYYTSSSGYRPLATPKRLVDTRAGQIGEIEKPGGSVGNDVSTQLVANVPTRWVVTNQAGIPSTVAGLAVNLTAISPPSGGNVRLYPCTTAGATPPSTSNINYIAGKTLANSAIVTPATNGGICALSTATVHIIIDTSGYLSS